MSDRAGDSLIFGIAPSTAEVHPRPAAYAVIHGDYGRVAAVSAVVRDKLQYWLPGGGSLAGETADQTINREVREELGREVQLIEHIGKAVQFFYAGDEKRWYRMTAEFWRAEFIGTPVGLGEHELRWLDPDQQHDDFFHACHGWAVERAAGASRVA
jgi:8-oxo-dGTP pyrophosphatase MutT (NUDIX family)